MSTTKLAALLASSALLVPSGPVLAASHEGKAAKSDAGTTSEDELHVGMDTPDEHVVEPGDTLARLAQDYLGSSDLWRRIAEENGIEDPRTLRVGQRLRIPKRQVAE